MDEFEDDLLDTLMQLCKHGKLIDAKIELDYEELLPELIGQGFDPATVLNALDWIRDLLAALYPQETSASSTRVFSPEECDLMDAEARNCLIKLENVGILNPVTRERVIEQVMALRKKGVGNSLVKWVAYLVLSAHPGQDIALNRMELFVADRFSGGMQ